jgi:quinoprotein glucose dehydrogenase
MSDRIRNHPALKDMDLPNGGSGTVAPMTVTPSMLMYASTAGDGTPMLFGVDKATGKEVGRVEVPERSRYGMMTYMHEGRQYIVLQTGSKLTALALPSDEDHSDDHH